MYQVYRILNGETIESIAKKLNITSDELRRLNGIGDNASLREGSYIIIPNVKQSSDSEYITYIVKEKDNLYNIAREYNVDYKTLIKLNGLKEGEYIYPNEEIKIPREKMYITDENDKIEDVLNKLNLELKDIKDLYLKEDQIITIKS